MLCDCSMAVEDMVKVYDEIRSDLDAAFQPVAKSVSASLVESEVVSHSVEAKCWQTLQKKYDVYAKKMNAERRSRMEKLRREHDLKNKVN